MQPGHHQLLLTTRRPCLQALSYFEKHTVPARLAHVCLTPSGSNHLGGVAPADKRSPAPQISAHSPPPPTRGAVPPGRWKTSDRSIHSSREEDVTAGGVDQRRCCQMRLQPQGYGAPVEELSMVLGLVRCKAGKVSPMWEKKKEVCWGVCLILAGTKVYHHRRSGGINVYVQQQEVSQLLRGR